MGKHFIATIDTGGIKYGGVEAAGLGRTVDEAKEAVVAKVKTRISTTYGATQRPPIETVEEFEEWFGIRVYGPLSDGEATVAE